ncbi:type 1 glutamine amidotransferase family protein [Fodinicola feengrottensis]|uniref:hypothetical protein n=1 Tax=Fodinicola feengrottensis TaxID=435914 RepID=UPI0028BDBD8D|nr:hypothetical protein [Fodinicola feengrottensis]
MRTIALLLQPGNNAFDVGVAIEVWGRDRTEHGVPPFELRTCARTREPVALERAACRRCPPTRWPGSPALTWWWCPAGRTGSLQWTRR